jgi:hypothetical protein
MNFKAYLTFVYIEFVYDFTLCSCRHAPTLPSQLRANRNQWKESIFCVYIEVAGKNQRKAITLV